MTLWPEATTKLYSITPDTRGAGPDKNGLSARRWRHSRMRQCKEILHKQPTRSSRQAERQSTHVLIGDGAGDVRGHVGPDDGIFPERDFSRLATPLIHPNCMTYDTVAKLEARDAVPHLDDLAGEIAAHDEGIFDPSEHHVAGDLCEPIKWIDGGGAILDDYLALGW